MPKIDVSLLSRSEKINTEVKELDEFSNFLIFHFSFIFSATLMFTGRRSRTAQCSGHTKEVTLLCLDAYEGKDVGTDKFLIL